MDLGTIYAFTILSILIPKNNIHISIYSILLFTLIIWCLFLYFIVYSFQCYENWVIFSITLLYRYTKAPGFLCFFYIRPLYSTFLLVLMVSQLIILYFLGNLTAKKKKKRHYYLFLSNIHMLFKFFSYYIALARTSIQYWLWKC